MQLDWRHDMGTQHGRINEPASAGFERPDNRGGRGAGSLLMAALLGVGIGLLAAPQPGAKTRRLLAKRLAALGEDMGEGLEEVQEVGSKAGKRVKRRLARLREEAGEEWQRVPDRLSRARNRFRDAEEEAEDEEESGSLGKVIALVTGLAATYFMTSERTATARTRVQETAADVGRRATDQWDRFQRGGLQGRREGREGRTETRTASNPSDEAPQAS
jgi:gas vesicle protein